MMQCLQICSIAEELLKTEYDALRIVYNKFGSAVSYKPTIATILSPDVRQVLPSRQIQMHTYNAACHAVHERFEFCIVFNPVEGHVVFTACM